MFKHTLLAALLALATGLVQAQEQDDEQSLDEASVMESLVGTGTRITAGGAQDINHFRSVALEEGEMPRPESLTVEGLLGQHDLDLPLARSCDQLLCLATEAMAQGLPTRPDDRLFVGLGFASNVDAATWKRAPLSLVAVVDKSGSMDGEPLALVRQALARIVGQLHDGDRLAIVLYGDQSHVYLPPSAIGNERAAVLAAIANIASAGSTNMEDGLKVGFATALAEARQFAGNTRVMLFTDEQPNVGATGAESFMGMAAAASKRGIGMTTIGVGVQFDGALATRVGSVRGGNLFFVQDQAAVDKLFAEELDTMVSEVAHDIRIALTPAPGYRISGIYGVPDGLLEQGRDGSIEVVVPTAFFSNQAGGIFLSLGKAERGAFLPLPRLRPGQALVDIGLRYVSALDGSRGRDRLQVAQATAAPSAGLRRAFALVDQFLAMREASLAYHRDGKAKAAFRQLAALRSRLEGMGDPALAPELQLVGAMSDRAALMSGYGGEASPQLRASALHGTWEVRRIDGRANLARGDQLEFDTDDTFFVFHRDGSEQDPESYSYDGKRLTLADSRLAFEVQDLGNRLRLRAVDGAAFRMDLVRVD